MRELAPVHSVSELMDLISSKLTPFHRHKVGDYSRETQYKFPFGIWFRGQSDESWPLTPKVFRKKEFDESSMFHHFQIRAPEYRNLHRSIFDWLCLMQHYGLPTRLLDWSESVLVALFFAVNERKDSDGRVFVLNAKRLNTLTTSWKVESLERSGVCTPWSLNVVAKSQLAVSRNITDWQQRMRSLSDMESWRTAIGREIADKPHPRGLSLPVAVLPSRLNGRMIFQSSCFTLHGGKMYLRRNEGGKDYLPEPKALKDISEDLHGDGEFLLSFTIPGSAKKRIRRELLLLGIHPGALFPEIDRQAGYIETFWRMSERDS